MVLPEVVRSIFCDHFVESVLGFGLTEWRSFCIYHKQDNACSKDVSSFSAVGLGILYFRRHEVRSSAKSGHELLAIAAGYGAGKTEINYLHVVIAIQHNVVRLQVSVSNSISVHDLQTFQELSEEVPRDPLTESLSEQEKLHKLAPGCILHSDVVYLPFFGSCLVNILSFAHNFDDIICTCLHLEALERCYFCLYLLQVILSNFWVNELNSVCLPVF